MYTDSHWWSHLGNECGKKPDCGAVFCLCWTIKIGYSTDTVLRLNSPCEESVISTRRWPSGGWEENCWLWIYSGISRIPWIRECLMLINLMSSAFLSLYYLYICMYHVSCIFHIFTTIYTIYNYRYKYFFLKIQYIFYIDFQSDTCSVLQIKIFLS